MPEDLKLKSVLVYDHGMFPGLAQRLARGFGRVGYFCDWESGAPDGNKLEIGKGLEGVERITRFWDVVDDFDLKVFPDVRDADTQRYLRRHGHRVFGSGTGSELELLRWKTHLLLPKLGLPQNEAVMVKGTNALRDYLKEHPKQFVKISSLRGITETFFAPTYEEVEQRIDEMVPRLGPRQRTQQFIIEAEIPDCLELGYDGYSIDGIFPDLALWGIEKKDAAYAGKICQYDELPDGVRQVNDGLAPAMKEMQYRSFFSSEIREKDSDPFLIDATARHPSPAGECELELFGNLPEIVWEGSEGRMVQIKPAAQFAAQVVLKCEFADENWMAVRVPKEIERAVKLYRCCVQDGIHYVAPEKEHQMAEIGSVIGLGETADDAKTACLDSAEQVSGSGLKFDADALDAAFADLEKAG